MATLLQEGTANANTANSRQATTVGKIPSQEEKPKAQVHAHHHSFGFPYLFCPVFTFFPESSHSRQVWVVSINVTSDMMATY